MHQNISVLWYFVITSMVVKTVVMMWKSSDAVVLISDEQCNDIREDRDGTDADAVKTIMMVKFNNT